MRLFSSKISTLLLTLLFLISSVLSIPGFAWCFGEDGHIEIEYVSTGDCGDRPAASPSKVAGTSQAHIDEDHCGPCQDIYLQAHEARSVGRIYFKAPLDPGALAFNTNPSISSPTVRMVVGNLVPQPPPRIPRSILEHRTIVLLN